VRIYDQINLLIGKTRKISFHSNQYCETEFIPFLHFIKLKLPQVFYFVDHYFKVSFHIFREKTSVSPIRRDVFLKQKCEKNVRDSILISQVAVREFLT
jgi:hypothetical protein